VHTAPWDALLPALACCCPKSILVADRSSANAVGGNWTVGKGQYFDLQASSAFADFQNGPAVSTGPPGLLKKLFGAAGRSIGNQVRPAVRPLVKGEYFDFEPSSADFRNGHQRFLRARLAC
jgi:hypothetical protein